MFFSSFQNVSRGVNVTERVVCVEHMHVYAAPRVARCLQTIACLHSTALLYCTGLMGVHLYVVSTEYLKKMNL